MLVSFIAFAAALSLALGSKELFEIDQARITASENLRGSRELLVTDLRQAGERLPSDFPAVELLDGGVGAPDELILRRNRISTVLRVCKDLGTSDTKVHVAEIHVGPPPISAPCLVANDVDTDGWPDNVQSWRAFRLQNGPSVRAYVYDPVNRVGEFFDYEWEETSPAELVLRAPAGQTWQRAYSAANECRLYLLEERRYGLNGDLLELRMNDEPGTVQVVANRIDGFQALAVLGSGVTQAAFGVLDDWKGLEGIRVTLDSSKEAKGVSVERSWTSEVLPRNAMAR
jgi:type IV pilus assembly protein PilW